jgi:hypothetical protein
MVKLTTLLTFAFLLIGLSAYTAVHTVSNTVNSPGQFTSLQAAINAASPGDTIYVSGSPASYGNAEIFKRLTLIGAGYNPNNQFQFPSTTGTIKLRMGTAMEGNTNPSETEITGLIISTLQAENNINGIVLNRNEILSSINFYYNIVVKDWVIKNNIINDIQYASKVTNFVIHNNIFKGRLHEFNSPTISISNNIFTFKTGAHAFVMDNVNYAIVTNNIYYGKTTDKCNYCTFNNNISFGSTYTTFKYANNTGENNLENINPLFVHVPETDYKADHDYHLQSASQGKNKGTDGKDIGIYGGMFPFPGGANRPWQTSPMPAVPQVVKMNVKNSVLPVNGTLQVEIEAISYP